MEDGKRFKNFSETEVEVLISLVQKYSNILENKKSNAVTWQEKTNGWEALSQEFQNITGNNRNAKNLRGKWENLKKETKKKIASAKQELYKTGGGPYSVPKMGPNDVDIQSIVGLASQGLDNTFDNDNIEIIFENEETDKSLTFTQVEPSSRNADEITLEGGKGAKELVNGKIEERTLQCGSNWTKLLKTPKSSPLSSKGKQLNHRVKKKSDITNECKNRITALCEVRMELCQLQIQTVRDENIRKEEEHKIRIAQQEEIHLLEVERKKLQLKLLKKTDDY